MRTFKHYNYFHIKTQLKTKFTDTVSYNHSIKLIQYNMLPGQYMRVEIIDFSLIHVCEKIKQKYRGILKIL